MRVLFASTRGAGHFNPLVPLIEAARRRGHEVLVAGPSALAPVVEPTGYPFWECADPAEEDIRPVWERVPTVSQEEANVLVVREIFARLDARAMLPRLREACEEWRPGAILREPNEYASAVAADLHGIPHARVAIGLAAAEERALRIAAATVDELRHDLGLPADPHGERIRSSPYLTAFPESLEDPAEPAPPSVLRFRLREPTVNGTARELPDWWPGADGPLVYVTFGSVAATIPQAAAMYAVAVEAAATLPARVLLTVGPAGDPDALGPLPANVHVERWVPHADVVAAAHAVVCHGGSGSVLGTLAAGLPQVVVPLFADQPLNAERVAAVGAGVVAAPRAEALRAGVLRVLEEPSYGEAARAVAAEMRGLRPAEAVLETVLAPSARG